VRGQAFGISHDVVVELDQRADRMQGVIKSMAAAKLPDCDVRRFGTFSARVSGAR
jgi:hypothetical protein